MNRFYLALSCLVFLSLTACDVIKQSSDDDVDTSLKLRPVAYSQLIGWDDEDFKTLIPAFTKSCTRILRAPLTKKMGALPEAGVHADWNGACKTFLSLVDNDPARLRIFFETYFTPYAVSAGEQTNGLFTGYYEATLKGSRMRTPKYNVPLHTRPDDLVMVDLGQFRDDLKGRRIAGRVKGGQLKPYENRTSIVAGEWPHNDEVLVWVDDPVDAFFVQIQGSGIVELDDGNTDMGAPDSIMRIGYAGQNGHPYYAIGRELIARGELTKENVSLQSIRAWLEANPLEADAIMNTNASYVFFNEIKGEGPIGGEGVALTGGRSLAIDRSLLAYGLPIWTDIAPPIPGETPHIRRMMIAQDTGGAIRGAVRGDVFWGYGDTAEHVAGQMKSEGRYWVLLPK